MLGGRLGVVITHSSICSGSSKAGVPSSWSRRVSAVSKI